MFSPCLTHSQVKKKPYIQLKDSAGRTDEDVAQEYWSAHQQRNQSFVGDRFMGQFKSTLACPWCPHTSVTFDPYSCVSLPLAPVTASALLDITFVPESGARSVFLQVPVSDQTTLLQVKTDVARQLRELAQQVFFL
jgi:hypothetical protein